MSRKPSKRQLAMSSVTRCSYASRKLPRGSCPLPPLHASLGGLQPVYTIILRSVMGGCEIVDYASRTNTSRAEERLVVDLAMIGRDYPLGQGPDTGNSIFQQQPIIVNADQLASSDTPNAIKSDELSLMETQKLINDNDDSNNDNNHASNNNNNYEYANLIEGMINNVMESTTPIKTMEKENNNNNNENSFEFFNYDSSQIVELTSADSSAPVIISLQNFYDPLGASHTPQTQMTDFQQLGNLSTGSSAESGSSPASTVVDLDNEHSRYCNPDVYKVYREGLDGSAFSVVQSDGFDGFFEFDTLSTHPRITIASSIAEETAMTPVIGSAPRRRRKREQKVLSSWEREKRICCSQCSKKFRTTAHLKTHFVVHTMGEGTKLSRCAVCDKGFCHRGALTLHMRAHASKESSRLRGEGC